MNLDSSVVSFAESIVSDLRAAGIDASLEISTGGVSLHIPQNARMDESTVSKAQRQRANELLEDGNRGRAIEAMLPAEGSVDLSRITPVLQIARSAAERNLFEYCRLSQKVPSGQRIGRQIRALVLDVGQVQGPRLIGAFGLASPLYAVACRDRFLNWSGSSAKSRKNAGLRRMMDLHLCTALAPYNTLFAGKLLAALAASVEIRQEFNRRYDDPLLGVNTSCASGTHCAGFNRIMLCRGGLYRRLGVTSGYTLAWMSPQTLQLARRVAGGGAAVTPHSILDFDLKPLLIVRRALKVTGIPFDQVLRLGQQKGVYFAETFPGAAELLRRGELPQRWQSSFGADEAIVYWRAKFLSRRLHPRHPSEQDVA